jgi:hypothetical protein
VVPFPANNISQLLIAIIQSEAPPLFQLAPKIGEPLCAVVDKALKKDRDQRYAHAADMHDALLAAAAQIPRELDRQAPLFPPEKIRTRVQSRRPLSEENPPQELELQHGSSEKRAGPPTRDTVHERGARGRRPASLREEDDGDVDLESDYDDESEFPDEGAPRAKLTATADMPPSAAMAAGPVSHSLTPARFAMSLGVLAVLSLGVAVSAIIVMRDRAEAPVGTGMIVVQAPTPSPAAPAPALANDVAPTSPKLTPEKSAEPAAPASTAEPVVSRAAERRSVGTKRRAAPVAAADPNQQLATGVASAFSKQKERVIDCLNKHPDEVEGSPQLTVRVSIDTRGKVTQSELLPEAISSKPVGSCVRSAVSAMSFPATDQPMTFRVPLTWRRK